MSNQAAQQMDNSPLLNGQNAGKRKGSGISISKYLSYLFLIILCIIWIVPVIFGITTSFRSQTEVVSSGVQNVPERVDF